MEETQAAFEECTDSQVREFKIFDGHGVCVDTLKTGHDPLAVYAVKVGVSSREALISKGFKVEFVGDA